MPPWGRPSGTGTRRAREQWYAERRRWEEQQQQRGGRFEELDSDYDDDYEDRDVSWDVRVPPRQIENDESYFTGMDLGATRPRGQRPAIYANRRGSGDEETDSDDRDPRGTQVALRDKEAQLVATAMERIRRAQMKGKNNVRLSPLEYEALERERRRNRSGARTPQRAAGERSGSRTPRRSRAEGIGEGRDVAIALPASRRPVTQQAYDPESPPYIPGDAPDNYLDYYGPPDAAAADPYSALNYQPLRRKRSANPLSRPDSSHGGSPSHTPPRPDYPRPSSRYFSLPEAGHPGAPSSSKAGAAAYPQSPPHAQSYSRNTAAGKRPSISPVEPTDWVPRARSRSSAQVPYPVDSVPHSKYPTDQVPHAGYPVVGTSPYGGSLRGVSDPVTQSYGSMRRQRPPIPSQMYPGGGRQSVVVVGGSDPALSRRGRVSGSFETSADEGEDEGERVVAEQVHEPVQGDDEEGASDEGYDPEFDAAPVVQIRPSRSRPGPPGPPPIGVGVGVPSRSSPRRRRP
ncbi:MAG: hypothetical protein M1823_002310 [Watsoniomyces obsoletus]|nr:MAG: hypothetical protein M1823_002310 [Watsoniomyces obsoletus]